MPRHLLILTTDLQIGGTPTVVRELAVRLHGRGHAVSVACLAPSGPVAKQIADAGVAVTALGARGPLDLRILPRLLELIRNSRPDTLLSLLIHANALATVAAAITGIELYQSIQTTQPDPRWHWALQRLIAPAARRIIVPSPSVAQMASVRCSIPQSQIEIIPNAIDPSDFDGISPAAASRKPGQPAQIGFIGRLDPIKCIPDLLAASAILNLTEHPVHLHIFGEGPQRSELESRIRDLRAQSSVTLHGAVERPQEALRQIQLLVLPSQAEGFGLVLIEAMAAGIPIVATSAPGIRDVVQHDKAALLVPVASPASLATAIGRLVSDAPLRDRLTRAGRLEVARRFAWSAILPRYERLFFGP